MAVQEGDSVPEPGPDLQYDLAHESMAQAGAAAKQAGQHGDPEVYVATETEGFQGDYGYDLAHDVPKR